MKPMTLLTVAIFAAAAGVPSAAEDNTQGVSFDFSKGSVPGFPPSGSWTMVDNWSPTVCLVEGGTGCAEKGYPGQQSGIMHKVTLDLMPNIPGPATMELNVPVSLAKLSVGADVVLNVASSLGMNWYETPPEGGPTVAKTALLSNAGIVNLSGSLYSNSGVSFEGGGDFRLLGATLAANGGLHNAGELHGFGKLTGGRLNNLQRITADTAGAVLEIGVGGLLAGDVPAAQNFGVLRAIDGGLLRLVSSGSGGFLANGTGLIEAGAGSSVELRASVRGGDFAGAGTISFIGNGFLEGWRNAGQLRLAPGSTATVHGANGGNLINDGQFEVAVDAGVFAPTRLVIEDDVAIGGAGTVLMRGAKSQIVGQGAAADFRIGSAITLRGAGLIGGNGPADMLRLFDNAGVVRANLSGQTLLLRGKGLDGVTDVANTGYVEATDGGVLEIRSSDVANGGSIKAHDGSLVDLNGVRVTGGVLDTAGGLIKVRSNSTLAQLENRGTLRVEYTDLLGTLTNRGVMEVHFGTGVGSYAGLGIAGEVLLTGTGVLDLKANAADPYTARIRYAGSGGVLTNDTMHSILGAGAIGVDGALGIRNRGLIDANRGALLTLIPAAAQGGLINEGRLRASAGSSLRVEQHLANYAPASRTLTGGRYEVTGTMRLPVGSGIARTAAELVLDGAAARLYSGNSGTIDALAPYTANLVDGRLVLRNGHALAVGDFTNAGQIEIGASSTLTAASYTQISGHTAVDGALIIQDALSLAGGTLGGSGTIIGTLTNAGTLSPGNSPGVLAVTGDYVQSGTLVIELGATAYDKLLISGTALLGGTLEVELWSAPGTPAHGPLPGASFDLLAAQLLSGTFDQVKLPAVTGIQWDLGYLPDALGDTDVVRLTALPSAVPLPGALPHLVLGCSLLVGLGCRRRQSQHAG